jgi:uncharacterized damage-inducible protein DinB
MQLEDIKDLFEYNDWANDILVDMLVAAFGEELDLRTSAEPMVTEIQETTVHIFGALSIWRLRWLGTSLSTMLDPAPYPTPLSLRAAFHEEKREFWRFFNSLDSDERLNKVYIYTNTRGETYSQPLTPMMIHVVNHSSYHRGQVTAKLMALGHDELIESTDFAAWTILKMQSFR